MNEEFEILFRKICWRLHIDVDFINSNDYREFAETFYKLGL